MKRYIGSLMALVLVANASEFVVVKQSKDMQTKLQKSDVKKSGGKRTQSLNFELIKIKENNVTRNMFVPMEDVNLTGISRQLAIDTKLNSKDGLLIAFNDENIDIEAFEKSFSLTLKEKLQIGYHVFENHSALGDVALMRKILNSNYSTNIKSIKPNWKMQMKKF